MGPALFALDQRRPLSRRAKLAIGVGLVAYAVITGLLVTVATTPLQAVPWVPVSRSLLFAVITGICAVLLYGQARTTQQRGYVWMAGGYLYVALLNAADPLFRVGAFTQGAPVLGSTQSAAYLTYQWVFFVPIGFVYAAWLLRPPVFSAEEPHLRGGLAPRVATVCLLALVSIALAAWAVPYLPVMTAPDGSFTPVNIKVGALWLPYAVVAAIVSVMMAVRFQTVIHRWIAAMMLIILGSAIVGILTQPWSLGSYYNAVFTVISASLLLIVLLANITRINQATNIAATRDELTNSASRLSLTRDIDNDLDQSRACALLWVSVDGFDAVTAAIGHEQGDEALRVLVARFMSIAQKVARVGRLGNSEFGITVANPPNVPTERLELTVNELSKSILEAARESITLNGVTTWVSCSVGIASTGTQAATTDKLLQYADLAMRAARSSGGDRCQWFNDEIGEADIGQALLRQKLNRSIQNEDFDIDYQPIVTPAALRVVGVESLVRWLCDGQRISAGQFIELAERTGQIVSIGRIVVAKLESHFDAILGQLPPGGFITFNLSVPELSDETIIERLCQGQLADRAQSLIVEITESVEMDPRSTARANLGRLRAAHYRIAIDDFGSGFSNFTFLENIRPYLLKIDRAIVVRAGVGAEGGLAFLSAAVHVARSLNCAVLAEGIELADEETVVTSLDIDYLQGYRYGRPTPLDSLLRNLTNQVPTEPQPKN